MGLGALRRVNALYSYLSLMGDSGELTQVTGKAGERRLLISQGEGEAASLGGHQHQWGEGRKPGIAILCAVLSFQLLCQGECLVLSD